VVATSPLSKPGRALGLALFLCGAAAPLRAQTDPRWLSERMTEWYETASRRAPGHWGVAIGDPSGRILWSVNPEQELVPASTVKLFTTGFARSVLGGTARRPTRVIGHG
jgi:D-alanyl-D-alanine carboxypeptidase